MINKKRQSIRLTDTAGHTATKHSITLKRLPHINIHRPNGIDRIQRTDTVRTKRSALFFLPEYPTLLLYNPFSSLSRVFPKKLYFYFFNNFLRIMCIFFSAKFPVGYWRMFIMLMKSFKHLCKIPIDLYCKVMYHYSVNPYPGLHNANIPPYLRILVKCHLF